jgi:hypothetical protein
MSGVSWLNRPHTLSELQDDLVAYRGQAKLVDFKKAVECSPSTVASATQVPALAGLLIRF